MSSSHGPTPSGPAALPSHPDARIDGAETPFSRFLRVDVVRFRHRLFSGEWSGERVYDVLRPRGALVPVALLPAPASAGRRSRRSRGWSTRRRARGGGGGGKAGGGPAGSR